MLFEAKLKKFSIMARRSGSGAAIVELLFLIIRFYWVWQLCPIWIQAPLQCVAIYYIVIWYLYFIPLYYKDVMDVFAFDDWDGTEIILGGLIVSGVPILFYFLYFNTLNKVYASISDIFGTYQSYFGEAPHEH
eukprot:UN08759